jgi:hypothetical protein
MDKTAQKLACALVHIIDFYNTGNSHDFIAFDAIMQDSDVHAFLVKMRDEALLPKPRHIVGDHHLRLAV